MQRHLRTTFSLCDLSVQLFGPQPPTHRTRQGKGHIRFLFHLLVFILKPTLNKLSNGIAGFRNKNGLVRSSITILVLILGNKLVAELAIGSCLVNETRSSVVPITTNSAMDVLRTKTCFSIEPAIGL